MNEIDKLKQFCLERRKQSGRKGRTNLREKLFNILGHICIRWGFSDKRALQFDHKNGGGIKDVKKFNGNYEMYRYYKNNPEIAKKELQVLCANCNWIKRAENKEYREENT